MKHCIECGLPFDHTHAEDNCCDNCMDQIMWEIYVLNLTGSNPCKSSPTGD